MAKKSANYKFVMNQVERDLKKDLDQLIKENSIYKYDNMKITLEGSDSKLTYDLYLDKYTKEPVEIEILFDDIAMSYCGRRGWEIKHGKRKNKVSWKTRHRIKSNA